VNGVEAVYDQFPWIVSLQYRDERYNNEYMHYCGGSIIDHNVIVTAAHCSPRVSEKNMQVSMPRVRVVAGCLRWDMSDEKANEHCQSIEIDAADFTDHPKYTAGNLIHDITIGKLPSSFQMTDSVGTICLPEPDTLFKGMATIAGWGKHNENQTARTLFESNRVLRAADVNILQPGDCDVYEKKRYDPVFNMCAGFKSGFRDSCQGDSGGPLMAKYKDQVFLIGIVSFGSGCARQESPGVYVRMTRKKEWIQSIVNI
jgi:secreted trypsin-like serine protease